MPVQSKPQKPTQLTSFGYALAGALGGCFSNAVVYPLDTIKTRIQAANTEDGGDNEAELSVTNLALKIVKEEGLTGLYGGFAATMLNTFSMQYAYFFFYSVVRTSYIKRLAARRPPGAAAQPLSTAAELLLGAVAGALAQIFTIPVAVIATRQQIGSRSKTKAKGKGKENADVEAQNSVEEEERDDSFFGVAREIVREEGVTGLWLGIKPGLVLTVNPAITYGMYERIKSVLLLAREKAGQTDGKLTPLLSFALGALSKTLATVVTYPYIMAKVRIQTRSADDEEAKEEHRRAVHHGFHHKKDHHPGALDILRRVWKHQGFLGWYQGMGAQVLKAVLSQGVLFMSKERFEHWALTIIVFYWRLTHGRHASGV
ncbi:adenine nucleotide transporter [Auriscalpium vulgare]|uniref:Adenine nucleotide transporter n=1 Tax=Auriscalpium vulgare TaxID=40419 RepID=A0ACB8S789_9AGAM|nr:adenine nucleotide transporter [Auriscalpium vulgare]